MTSLAPPRTHRHRAAPLAGPAGLPRLLSPGAEGGALGLAEHLDLHGPAPATGRRQRGESARHLAGLLEQAGLAGRGGAGFPTARKLAAVSAGRRAPALIANGTEGEPASAKDRVLLRNAPHLVLDGAATVGAAIGAARVVVVVHPDALAAVQEAAAERIGAGLDETAFEVTTAAPGFVAGEETAVVQWAQRGVAKPTATPPRPFERGLDGRPTLVQNVETLAHLALIARYGAAWFRSVGTAEEPGSMLATVLGPVGTPGVLEIPIGIRVGDVVAAAGGAREPLRALLLGGYFGTFVPADEALGRPFSRAGLRPIGASSGAGLVAAIPASACGLADAARIVDYLARQSAGQCGPCVFGLPAVAGEISSLATPGAARAVDRARLERWLSQVEGRGACRHPDGVVRLARSALATFSDEIRLHLRGRCTAGSR
jgi:NADH:ubiquinone oxidoreductase subunit F (NADH-binding)